jgi:hydroxymethylpyrimidine pyrophosphatase-like HAD family hydrolase/fructoselysine-6-P-deglycase FrlB-like protein
MGRQAAVGPGDSVSRYQRELAALSATYREASAWDTEPLARVVGALVTQGLRVVGSGGSYSLATFCARLHTYYSRQVAFAATPLDIVQTPYVHATGLFCLTASGSNKDIRAAFEAAALAETKPTAALCLAKDSPIKALSERYAYTDVIEAPLDIESDGFLAVNSVLAVCILLARAYRSVLLKGKAMPDTFESLMAQVNLGPDFDEQLMRTLEKRRTISVLYSPTLAAAATDLESRFIEGALGNLHSADWRNFGHGRHHWLAKRADETGIIALVDERDVSLARRTLDTIPAEIPRVSVTFSGDADIQAMGALVMALKIAGAAGEAIGIDPGRPGVPEFGRKLYGLGPRLARQSLYEASVQRKIRVAPEIEGLFRSRYPSVVGGISAARACGIVLDYDGTLCDRRRRFDPLDHRVAESLKALAATGSVIGIATGRGQSAGAMLTSIFPRDAWSRVLIGYYNGAIIAPLGALLQPEDERTEIATRVGERLQGWFPQAKIDVRNCQVSANGFHHGHLATIAHTAARLLAGEDLPSYVVCSSHSIDVLLTGYRKDAVVDAVRAAAGHDDGRVIRIGDRGSWPGNDFDLLSDSLGLSVDEVSRDPDRCWNISPPGLVGPQATLYYLDRLVSSDGQLKLDLEEERREALQH